MTPTPLIPSFDPRQLYGLGGLTLIEAFIKYLQNQWRFPKTGMMPVIASLVFGVLLNVGLAIYFHLDATNAILVGVMTGASATVYHKI